MRTAIDDNKERQISDKRLYEKALLFFLPFLLVSAVSFQLGQPVNTDEYGILFNAAFLSGKYNWWAECFSSSIPRYWGYGQSLLYIPLFWLFSDMNRVLFFGRIINAAVISIIPILSYSIIDKFFISRKRNAAAFFISAVIGFFPASITMAKTFYNETLLVLFVWIVLYLLLNISVGKENNISQNICFALLGLCSVFCLAIHNRGVVILIAATMLLALIFIKKRFPVYRWLIFIIPGIATYYFDKKVKNYLLENLIRLPASEANNTVEATVGPYLLEVFHPDYFKRVLKGFLGLSWYTVWATYGLILIFAVFVLYIVLRGKKFPQLIHLKRTADADMILGLYASLCVFGTLLLTTLFFSKGYMLIQLAGREYLIYGRYIDSMLGVVVFFVLLQVFRLEFKPVSHVIISIIAYVATAAVSFVFIGESFVRMNNKRVSILNVSSVAPFFLDEMFASTTKTDFLKAILIFAAISLFLYLLFLFKKKKLLAISLLCLSLYSSTMFSFQHLQSNSSANDEKIDSFSSFCHQIGIENYSDVPIYLSSVNTKPFLFQFAAPKNTIIALNTASSGFFYFDRMLEDSFIISTKDENFELALKNCHQVATTYPDLSIWVYGEALYQRLEASGTYFLPHDDLFLSSIGLSTSENFTKTNYFDLPAGNYVLTLTNSSLSDTGLQMSINAGRDPFLPEVNRISSDVLEVSFLLDSYTRNIQLLFTAPEGEDLTLLSSGKLKRMNDKISTAELSLIQSSEIALDFTDWRTKDKLNVSSESWRTGAAAALFDEGYVEVNDISLNSGPGYLRINGTGLDSVYVKLYADGQELDVELKSFILDSDLVVKYSIPNQYKNAAIKVFSNNKNGESIIKAIKIVNE